MYPNDRQYSPDHEWLTQDAPARVGITQFAATALDEAVYVELPEVGSEVTAGEACGEIESVKSVSDLVAPASGTVVAVNDAVIDDPKLATDDPHGDGWLYELEVSEPDSNLMDSAAYEALTAETQ
ncbi:glycine cleavage system protein GcvH [Flaviflexus equikiangi]|uniref:Glycine cleavage system H protein n=1 Tax=Flaviflexus equikiangi TaxID=2758573 RepID=A0ABS2THM2_9ACTO|nr:glycine cleavage system protein GcvH [Flaviflexus equikiangi]MBM9433277.1 glycine cleavage system protein GcvH [Flaviflexus equikiangi]